MAIVSDLTGLGTPAELASKLGHNIATLIGIGTSQTGAAKIGSSITIGKPVTGQTAYTLPATAASMGKEFYFFNAAVGADTALIFAPLGGATLNGSTSASVSVAQNKGAQFILTSGSGGNSAVWLALVGA